MKRCLIPSCSLGERNAATSLLEEAFSSEEEPLEALRIEGELAAKAFRDGLDKVSPVFVKSTESDRVAVCFCPNSGQSSANPGERSLCGSGLEKL